MESAPSVQDAFFLLKWHDLNKLPCLLHPKINNIDIVSGGGGEGHEKGNEKLQICFKTFVHHCR